MAASKAAKSGSRGGSSSSGGGAKTAAKSAPKVASKGGASSAKSAGGAKSAAKGGASGAKSASKGGAAKGGAAKSRTNHGNPWSTADMKQLRQLAREKTLIRVAAEQLGRSLDSVKSKASEEGISFKGPKRAAAAGKRSR